MMNILWISMIFLSILYGIISGNTLEIANSIFPAVKEAVTLTLSLLGMFCFWGGITAVCEAAGLTEKIARVLSPLLNLLFPHLKKEAKAKQAISMNLTANLLGIGNAATPLGLRAMRELKHCNPNGNTASDEMVLFVILNTASLRIIPTTAALLRAEFGASNPMDILLPCLLTSLCSCLGAVFLAKFAERYSHA